MFFIGDTHGIKPIFQIVDKLKLQDSNLIHIGDLGLGFQEMRRDISDLLVLDEMLFETNNVLYAMRGNHDNPIFWDRSKGLNLPKFHNLKLVEDYSIHTIEKKNVLFVGGAISIDRRPRMEDFPYPTWWKDEEFVYDENKLATSVKKYKDIDIVCTHTAPGFCHPTNDNVQIVNHYQSVEAAHGIDLKKQLREERSTLTQLYDDLTLHYKKSISHWFYGHFHSSMQQEINKTLFTLLNINEVYEIPKESSI